MGDWVDLLRDAPNPADTGQVALQGFQQGQQMRQQQQQIAALNAYRGQVANLLKGGDYQGAAAAAAAAGDDKAAASFITLDKNKYDQGSAGADSFGQVVRGISSLPYEQRAAAIQAAKPALVAHGFHPNDIDTFDPSDANLAGVSGLGYSAHERASDNQAGIDGQTKAFEAQTGRQNADTNLLVAQNPVVVGNSLVGRSGNDAGQVYYRDPQWHDAPMSDNVSYDPGVNGGTTTGSGAGMPNSYRDPAYATAEAAAETKLGLPRGILASIRTNGERSNNDQVSSAGAHTVYQFTPTTAAGVKSKYGVDISASPENAALGAGLLIKEGLQRNHGQMAAAVGEYIGGIDRRNWGPQTHAYIGRVVNGGQPAATPIAGPHTVQRGVDPKAAENAPSNDPATVDSLARQYITRGELPPMGTGGANLRGAVYQRVAQIVKENGWTAGDIARNRAEYKASVASLTVLQKQRGVAATAEDNAMGAGQNYLDYSSHVSGQSKYRAANAVVNAYHRAVSDPATQSMDSAYQTFMTEYARVITASGTGGGTLSDSARHEQTDILHSNAGPDAKRAAYEAMRKDMAVRVAAIDKNINGEQTRIAGIGRTKASVIPAGATAMLKSNPALRAQFDSKYGQGASARVLGF